MILPRRLVLLGSILAVLPAAAQAPPVAPAPQNRAAAPELSDADEHNARLLARYKDMLAANPVEGLALDRLWAAAAAQGTTAALLEEYRRAASAPSPAPAAILVYGHLLQKADRLDEARTAFERAAAADPANLLAPLALGDLALARARTAEAAADYEAAVAKMTADDRRRPDILLKLGNAWLAAKEPLKAADAWEKIVAAAPGDVALHRRLAENYRQNQLPERAIAHYETIAQRGTPEEKAGAWRDLAGLHEARGDVGAASHALERGLALTARDNWLHGELERSLIRLYQRAGRVPELEARWRADMAQAPRDLGGYLRLEHLAAAQGDAESQRAWLEQIVALAPRDREDSLKLARLLSDAGERERAAAFYDVLLRDQPANLDLVLARAELDLQLGRTEAAVGRIEACVALAPADESVTTPALQFFLAHHLDQAAERRLQADDARQPQAEEPALALARFYFLQRRVPAARATLEALVRRPSEPAAQAARWLRVADLYKEQALPEDALRCWRQAASLNPAATAPWLAAADLLAVQEKTDAARDALEHAWNLASPGPERTAVDRKLFDLLQTADSRAAAQPASHRLGTYLAHLDAAVRATPTADAYLRLARWQAWNHAANDAVVAADKAITLDPKNIPARELLVELAGETHQRDAAEQRLREILTLDPSRNIACRREIAELKMEDGNSDEAIELYSELQADQPGSVGALKDLALAQQRVDRWYDALTTWKRAYALPGVTAAERADIRRPMLLALERLGQYPRGAEILQSAIDEQSDLAARQDLFRELAAFCQQHELTGWLQHQYEARLAAQPNDYFTLTALATLQKAGGHEEESYRLLRQADFSAPDPVPSLQGLVTAAEALGETGEAVSWQRRLLALPGQDTFDNLEKLAVLQDAGFATDEAARTWEQAVARFPRQTEVLGQAAEFFERVRRTGRARELLGQLVALEPSDLKRTFHLGQLDLAAGDRAGARNCFEQVLDRSEPEQPGQPFVPPAELKTTPPKPDSGFAAAVAKFRTRVIVAADAAEPLAPVPEDERQLRLEAIRELAQSLAAPGRPEQELRSWRERWQAPAASGARNEPLWAFYYSHEQALTMGALAGWMQGAPGDEALGDTFLSAGLHLGAYGTLAHWAWDETDRARAAANGQRLVGALIDFLANGGKPGPAMVAELFPAHLTVRELLWKAAEEGFAAQDRYAEAVELGERVVALASSARANFAVPVAQWELYLGHPEQARAVLRAALSDGIGDSFETGGNPIFTALREYCLLLPENERAGFTDDYLRRATGRSGPAHAILAAVLLHGLAGDLPAAKGDLDRLLALRMLASDTGAGSVDFRRWTYLLNNGLQLQEWHLEPLAAHLWQSALSEASAFERQDNDTLTVRADIRARLLGVQVALAPEPARARQAVEDYLREEPAPGNVALLAGQCREAGQWPAATILYEYLCRVEREDPEHWRNLFLAYQSTRNFAALDQALAALLGGTQAIPNGLGRIDLLCLEASAREETGDGAGARRLLQRARQKSPHSGPLLAQLANSFLAAGQTDQAAELWRQALPFDADGHAALALALLEEARQHRPAAIEALRQGLQHMESPAESPAAPGRPPGFNYESMIQLLGRLYATGGQLDDLRQLAAERLQAGDLNALIGMAAGLNDPAARGVLRTVLAEAVRRAHDPPERFRAELGVVDLYRTPANDNAACELELHRLDRLAGATPALHTQFMKERFEVARQRGAEAWLEGELQSEWQEGGGDIAAGEMLVRLYAQTDRLDGLRKTIEQIDHRPDLPEFSLFGIEVELGSSKYAGLALPVAERLTRRFPQKEAYALARARVCWMAGRAEEARAELEALDFTGVFRDNIATQIADLYLALGDRAGSREFLSRAVARDPGALRAPLAYVRLAQAELEEKRPEAARRLLEVAYRNPAVTDPAPLLAYLSATGHLGPDAANRLPGAEFPLNASGRAQLLAAICERLGKTQRAAEARRLAMAHPELWSDAPGVVAELCADAGPDDWPALAATLEDAVAQASPPSRALARSLGVLYVKWADAELADVSHAAEAQAHLVRAHELQPDDFPIARQLAGLFLAKKQTARATEALHDFLAADALPAERQEAQQILARR